MTGADVSDAMLAERLRRERRKMQGIVALFAVLGLCLLAFMVPWLRGAREVSGDPTGVATLQQSQCWNTWIVSGTGSHLHVINPPDAWLGTTSVRGELSLQGEGDQPYFVVESGERYLLGGSTGVCQPPPTTAALR